MSREDDVMISCDSTKQHEIFLKQTAQPPPPEKLVFSLPEHDASLGEEFTVYTSVPSTVPNGFRPEWFMVSPEVGRCFEVSSFKVGSNEQLASAEGVPLGLFAEHAGTMACGVLHRGENLRLTLRCSCPARFVAGVVGVAASAYQSQKRWSIVGLGRRRFDDVDELVVRVSLGFRGYLSSLYVLSWVLDDVDVVGVGLGVTDCGVVSGGAHHHTPALAYANVLPEDLCDAHLRADPRVRTDVLGEEAAAHHGDYLTVVARWKIPLDSNRPRVFTGAALFE